MAKLKLGALADDKPVKLTIELPAAVHRDLLAYAETLRNRLTGLQNDGCKEVGSRAFAGTAQLC